MGSGRFAGHVARHKGKFTWSQDILIPPDAKPGAKKLSFQIKLFVCDDDHCVKGEHPFDATIQVSDAPALALTPALRERFNIPEPKPHVVPIPRQFQGDKGQIANTTPGQSAPQNEDPFADPNMVPINGQKPLTADLITFHATVEPPLARRGETVRLTITGSLKKGHHTYPINVAQPTMSKGNPCSRKSSTSILRA